MKEELSTLEINYIFMGEKLGGFKRGCYQKYVGTEKYKEGINRLIELAKLGNLAITCKERRLKGWP
ncbi:MAG: hypothetical protein L6N94_01230 [Candidatus Methylarchaceae archaeon HK01M]|nr:hypothetical protein [Candidatus Methylarchaceae archaeon HK01M]